MTGKYTLVVLRGDEMSPWTYTYEDYSFHEMPEHLEGAVNWARERIAGIPRIISAVLHFNPSITIPVHKFLT